MISDPAQVGAGRARLSSVCEQHGDGALMHLSLLGIVTFDAENSLVCEPHVPPPFLLLCKQSTEKTHRASAESRRTFTKRADSAPAPCLVLRDVSRGSAPSSCLSLPLLPTGGSVA